MKNNFDKIIAELLILIQWLCWKYAENPSNPDHPKKPPINPKTGKSADVNDPDTWGKYEQAKAYYDKNKGKTDGIGFVFTKNDPYTGIDLDNCRNTKTGKIETWAQNIIDDFKSYSEVSPSGEGVHIIIKGTLSGRGIKVGNIEVYDDARYFTFTGNQVPGTPLTIKKKQTALTELYGSLLASKKLKTSKKKTSTKNQPTPTQGSPKFDGMTDAQIIAKVVQSGSGDKFSKLLDGDWQSDYKSQSEADLGFCSLLSKYTDSARTIDSIYRGSRLMRPKWDESHGGKTYGENTIAKVINNPNVSYGNTVTKETSQYQIAEEAIKQIGKENIFNHAKKFWGWEQEKGLWREFAEEEIKQIIHETAHQKKLTQSHVNSILGLIRTETYSRINKFNKIKKMVINCKNGELHRDDGEWVLKSHNRKSYFLHQIPVKYDPLAKCTKFKKFLNQVFENDSDRKEKIMLLQEFMGYALIRSCEHERYLMLIGTGSNGKSVILVVLTKLLGASNVAAVQPSIFEDKFTMAHLQGILANIITEIPQGAALADAKLKSLVSGERITAQHKFGKLFDFEPYATLIFSSNHLPHTKDCSHAFFRRAEILTFNRTFKDDEKDSTLKAELPKELPGILNFALAGLQRLYDADDFTRVKSSDDIKRSWEREADQVAAFVHDECILDPRAKIIIADLYSRYTAWAVETGVKTTVKQSVMTERLKRFDCNRHRGGKGTWMMLGIKLRYAD